MTQAQLRKELNRAIKVSGSQANFGRETGLDSATVSMVSSGKKPINERIANILGYDVKVVYTKRK